MGCVCVYIWGGEALVDSEREKSAALKDKLFFAVFTNFLFSLV